MPRYYTQCLATPSLHRNTGAKTREYDYVYRGAAEGYLFHDSEGITSFKDLHKAVWILSGLYDDAAAVFAVRVDASTVMVSFNTNSFPRPLRIESRAYRTAEEPYEWLGRSQPEGWVIENIQDLNTPVHAVRYDALFDGCGMLERMTDQCPCPRLQEGTCFSATVFQRIPSLETTIADYTTPTADRHQTTRYKHLDGYEYLPGQYMIDASFVDSLRPYDNYDFDLVQIRKKEFKDRGQRMASRNARRKEACSQCCFHRTYPTAKNITDCGFIDECTGPVTDAQVETLLWRWYRESTPYDSGSEGFTRAEIRYLIAHAGEIHESKAFSEHRKTLTKLAGFEVRSGGGSLQYRVVPTKGNLERARLFNSYAELRAVISDLPETAHFVTIADHMMLAHAVYSTPQVFRSNRRGYLERYAIQNTWSGLEVLGTNGRTLTRCREFKLVAKETASLFLRLTPYKATDAAKLIDRSDPTLRPIISYYKTHGIY